MKTFYEAGHDKPKFNRYNLFYCIEASLIVVVLYVLFCKYSSLENKTLFKIGLITVEVLVVVDCVLFLLQIFSSTKIVNNSNKDIICKPKTGTELFLLPAGEVAYDVDGYAIDGTIYKTPDGLHVTIDENKEMKIASMIGKIVGKITDAKVLSKAPDNGWQPLFEIATEEKGVA